MNEDEKADKRRLQTLERVRRYRDKRGTSVTRNAEEHESVTPNVERYEYDREKYPNFKAWKIAVERALRAQSYARKFPELIKPGDAKYSTVEWQYEHQGCPNG